MCMTYYTVDDLRPGKPGWDVRQFSALAEAIDHYQTLPMNGVRVLGMADDAHAYEYANKHWAEKIYIPTELIHNSDFVVRSHPAVLDGFVSFYRKAVQALNLFGAEHCVGDRAEQDYTGKVLVLSPDVLREQYWGQKYQLLYAQSGFGCKPHSSGRAVFATSLADGETARWNREDFVGVLDDKFLPEWAKPKLAELQAQEQTDAPTMGGMNMK